MGQASGRIISVSALNIVWVRWMDGYLERFNCKQVRLSGDLLYLVLEDDQNRHIPLKSNVRWFSLSHESHAEVET